MGRNVLEELKARAKSLPPEWQRGIRLVIFSLAGFTEELQGAAQREDVALLDASRLLGA